MASPEGIHEGTHYEVIDSVELARRWARLADAFISNENARCVRKKVYL
jgi:hypothetical protein